MRRLGIFMFYDPKGQVPAHVVTTLRSFAPHVDRLVFVANGVLDEASFSPLADLVDDRLVRDNTGFDVAAYKAGLDHVGPEELAAYDEVVLFNYTFFTAPDRVAPMFAAMAGRDLDFWGITEYRDAEKAFVQSYFLVTRKSLHADQAFASYWEGMPEIGSVDASLIHHEFRFTPHFRRLGYRGGAYIEPDPAWDGNTTLLDIAGLHARGMPVVKYRAFTFAPTLLQRRGGRSGAENLAFIASTGAYDMAEIWPYLVAHMAPDDLIRMTGLMRYVPVDGPLGSDVLALVSLEDPRTLEMALQRLERMPRDQVRVWTSQPGIAAAVTQAGFACQTTQARGLPLALWTGTGTDAGLDSAPAVGPDTLILCLSDFPGEQARYSFLEQLFAAYWDILLGEGAAGWLRSTAHLGLVQPLPDLVEGRSQGVAGLGADCAGWALQEWPDAVVPAVGQTLWPWRGNCLLRADVLRDAGTQATLTLLEATHAPRPDLPFCGPEGALPQLTRLAGWATGVVAPQARAETLLLQADLARHQAQTDLAAATRRFRADVALMRAPGGALYHDPRGLDQVAASVSVTTLGRRSKARVVLSLPDAPDITLRPTAFVRHSVDSAQIEGGQRGLRGSGGGQIHLRGWAFDLDSPDMPLYCGLLHRGQLLGRFAAVNGPRHDVREAFPDLEVHSDCGFEMHRNLPTGTGWGKSGLTLCFIDMTYSRVALVPV